MAFLINVYNAWAIELVLTSFPGLDSNQDLAWLIRSPCKISSIYLFAKTASLDHIAHELNRGPNGFGEPRIHFAVNCVSIGWPALHQEAFTGDKLERQLEEATVMFLFDQIRNRIEGNRLRILKIFDWYEEDFEFGWRGTESVNDLWLYKCRQWVCLLTHPPAASE